jgi:hypothetical protein
MGFDKDEQTMMKMVGNLFSASSLKALHGM